MPITSLLLKAYQGGRKDRSMERKENVEIGLEIALLFAVNFWGALILIGLEKLKKQLANDHSANLEGKRNKAKDHSAEYFSASDDRLV